MSGKYRSLFLPVLNKTIRTSVWNEDMGLIGDTFAYDTETTLIENYNVPHFVIGTAFNGKAGYFLTNYNLKRFWELHKDCTVYFHSAPFDIAVTTKACGFDFDLMLINIRDIAILYQLVVLAKEGIIPNKYSLDFLVKQYLDIEIPKDVVDEESNKIRESFGHFYNVNGIDYKSIPHDYLVYAMVDAVVTYELGLVISDEREKVEKKHDCEDYFLTHEIQLKGDIALKEISRLGLNVDPVIIKKVGHKYKKRIEELKATLEEYGFWGGKGSNTRYEQIISKIENEYNITIPFTPGEKTKTHKAEHLEIYRDIPFINCYLEYKGLDKIYTMYIEKVDNKTKVNPSFLVLKKTGRTSCRAPNLQNIPREGNIRDFFIPTKGYYFLAVDYSGLELCTLAQVCYIKYGESRMRELINNGVDLHYWFASKILNKPVEKITKAERQRAKAVNFGFPGGLGVDKFIDYAQKDFGVEFTVDEAKDLRKLWGNSFPETKKFLFKDNIQAILDYYDLSSYNAETSKIEIAAPFVFYRIAGGNDATTKGRVFLEEEIEWAFNILENYEFHNKKEFVNDIKTRKGSKELQQAIVPLEDVITLTGRIRANATYTAARNTQFQGLASDGAKLALYRLIRHKYRVVNFIHDEVIIELPIEGCDYNMEAQKISQIMIEEMQEVVPDVKIKVEYALMDRWYKSAKVLYDKDTQQLIPFTERHLKMEKE